MADSDSLSVYLRFLEGRLSTFRDSVRDLLIILTLEDRPNKVKAVNKCLRDVELLKESLLDKDWPAWFGYAVNAFQAYVSNNGGNPNSGRALIESLRGILPAMEAQKFGSNVAADKQAVDFSAVYRQTYDASKAPGLFDHCVELLQQMVDSGHIDSIRTIEALQKIIGTIRLNARGDYFATRGTWEFLRKFVAKTGINVLEEIPGVKSVVKGLRETVAELDKEMLRVHDELARELTDRTGTDLSQIEQRPLLLLGDDAAGNAHVVQ